MCQDEKSKKLESFLCGELVVENVGISEILDLIDNLIDGKVNPYLLSVLSGNANFDGNWEMYFSCLADLVSLKSKDRSTKVGCVITTKDHRIVSTGYNGFVRGTEDDKDEYHERPLKYSLVTHSEANAIFNAANLGHTLKNTTIYVSGFPCCECAKMIAQSGISKVIIKDKFSTEANKRWEESMNIAKNIFEAGNVEIVNI